jgi:nitroimidazol reductase NimA-like FMN-containing flavoprotein (pyridoxamine 5'-phosphate oxidase superfamily)
MAPHEIESFKYRRATAIGALPSIPAPTLLVIFGSRVLNHPSTVWNMPCSGGPLSSSLALLDVAMLVYPLEEVPMKKAAKAKILEILAANRIMTVATLRPDGWPQATTVGFVNDGLVLSFVCARDSQKATNIARDDRVSLTINRDATDPAEIAGLSMAARATRMSQPEEIAKVLKLLADRYPEYIGPRQTIS